MQYFKIIGKFDVIYLEVLFFKEIYFEIFKNSWILNGQNNLVIFVVIFVCIFMLEIYKDGVIFIVYDICFKMLKELLGIKYLNRMCQEKR